MFAPAGSSFKNLFASYVGSFAVQHEIYFNDNTYGTEASLEVLILIRPLVLHDCAGLILSHLI